MDRLIWREQVFCLGNSEELRLGTESHPEDPGTKGANKISQFIVWEDNSGLLLLAVLRVQ